MVNEDYMTFAEICRKDGVYVDKTANFMVKILKGKVFTKGRNNKWELRLTGINLVNKPRFLSYSKRQAKSI